MKTLAVIVLFAVFLPSAVHGLECYFCDSQSACAADVSTLGKCNATTGQSCMKILALGTVHNRGCLSSCTESNALNTGTWCCTSDLCNAATQTFNVFNVAFSVIAAVCLSVAARFMS